MNLEPPGDLSSPFFHLERRGNGLSLFWSDARLPADFRQNFSVGEGCLGFFTLLSGNMAYSLKPVSRRARKTSEVYVRPGDIVFSAHDCEGVACLSAGVPLRAAGVILSSSALEEMFPAGAFPAFSEAMASPGKGIRLHSVSPPARRTQAVVAQILACPMTEICRSLFLEGKCLELISLHLDGMASAKCPPPVLTKSDLEKIHAAREILSNNLFEPPGVRDLCTSCGLNAFKLQRGFHACFGNTVHGLLRKERMRHARDLLRDAETSVGIVANAVGYSNTGHFIAAFRGEFGITPGQMLKKTRRSLTEPYSTGK